MFHSYIHSLFPHPFEVLRAPVANSALGHRLSHSSVGAPATGGTTMPEEHDRSSFGSGIFCNKKICILKKHVVCLFGLLSSIICPKMPHTRCSKPDCSLPTCCTGRKLQPQQPLRWKRCMAGSLLNRDWHGNRKCGPPKKKQTLKPLNSCKSLSGFLLCLTLPACSLMQCSKLLAKWKAPCKIKFVFKIQVRPGLVVQKKLSILKGFKSQNRGQTGFRHVLTHCF